MVITDHPPHRSGRALLTHPAPTSGIWRKSVLPDKDTVNTGHPMTLNRNTLIYCDQLMDLREIFCRKNTVFFNKKWLLKTLKLENENTQSH